MIDTLEAALGQKAIREYGPMQPGDVRATAADVADLESAVGYQPSTPVDEGIARFVAWYRAYYGD